MCNFSAFKKVWSRFKVSEENENHGRKLFAAVVFFNSLNLGSKLPLEDLKKLVAKYKTRMIENGTFEVQDEPEELMCTPEIEDLLQDLSDEMDIEAETSPLPQNEVLEEGTPTEPHTPEASEENEAADEASEKEETPIQVPLVWGKVCELIGLY